MRYGAIDMGSNAVRLLIKDIEVGEKKALQEERVAYYRVPVRLGSDTFNNGRISEPLAQALVQVMIAFRQLLDVQGVFAFRACATSALRDAENRDEVVERIQAACGIKVDCISGEEEADLIFENFKEAAQEHPEDLLCIDVGGGSTELSVVSGDRRIAWRSFQLGTLRMLNGNNPDSEWEHLSSFVQQHASSSKYLAVGTGGNINRYHRMARLKQNEYLPYKTLRKWHKRIKEVPLHERSMRFDFKSNRADVIVPAGEIYLKVMQLAECDTIWVPKVGLSDGIIWQLWKAHQLS